MLRFAVSLVATIVILGSSTAATKAAYPRTCHGMRAALGMQLGALAPRGQEIRMHRLAAIGMIVQRSHSEPLGWLGLDDYGLFWIQFANPTGALAKAYAGRAFYTGTNEAFHYVGAEADLPVGYQVIDCTSS